MKKRSLVFFIIAIFFVTAIGAPVLAGEWDDDSQVTAPSMVGDFLVLRPLGFLATVLGTAFAVVSLPFQRGSDQQELARQKLIIEPGEFTFKRPLGQLPD